MDSMSLHNIQERPCGSIVVKLETKSGCTIVHERLNVSNLPCPREASFLDCAQEAFLSCESAMVKNVPIEVIAKMKALLQCRSLVRVKDTKKWSDDHGMAVKAICTSGGTMSVGSLIVCAKKRDFGTVSRDNFPKDAGDLDWESVDKEIDTEYTLIATNVPFLHAEVETQDFRFSLEATVIDDGQHVVNLCVLRRDGQVVDFDNHRYKEVLNRKLDNIDPLQYLTWSNFTKRKNMWNAHIQFCADMLLTDFKARTMIRTPLCTACVTRSDDSLCANVFIV